jgi:hypothetical protein
MKQIINRGHSLINKDSVTALYYNIVCMVLDPV